MEIIENLLYVVVLILFVMVSLFSISYLSSRFIVRGLLDEKTYTHLLGNSLYNRLYSCSGNISYLNLKNLEKNYEYCFPRFFQIAAKIGKDNIDVKNEECVIYTKICDIYGNCIEFGKEELMDIGFENVDLSNIENSDFEEINFDKICKLLYKNLAVSNNGDLLKVEMYICCI